MDILAHGLWGGAAFGWKRKYGWAFLFGVMPDLLAFGPFFIYRLIAGAFKFGKPEISSIPQIVFTSYGLSHSLFTAAILFLVIRFLIAKELSIPASAYPLHILLDIPTHDISFFPTPFLYPLFDVRVDGFSWGHPVFMLVNYTTLAAVYYFLFRWRIKRKREQAPSP
jgi:hypothetical protein